MNHQEPRSDGGVARPSEGLDRGFADWLAGNILLMSIAAVLGVVIIMNCVVPMVVSRRPQPPTPKPADWSATAPKSPAGARP